MSQPQEPRKPGTLPDPNEEERLSLVAEFWLFLRENKKWWLAPLLIVMALAGVVAYLANSAAVAPFVYPGAS